MDRLPVELRQTLLELLDRPELKAIRLTSKSWASLGAEYLVSPSFTTFPYRDDITRLINLSAHPKFSFRIQSLTFNLGEMNEYHARHNAYFLNYMREYESRLFTLEETWSTYHRWKALKEQYLPRVCDLALLTEAFSSLSNLRDISVSLTNFPFPSTDCPELLSQMWRIPSTRLLPRIPTTSRFTSLLSAISISPHLTIQTLSHDRLPFEFFAQNRPLISSISPAFTHLTSLALTLDYHDSNALHHEPACQNLALCLHRATNLHTLSLTFQSRTKVSISALLSACCDIPLRDLRSVRLEGIACTEDELVGFLTAHAGLKAVVLGGPGVRTPHQPATGGVHLREGTFAGLFERVGRGLGLESFEIMGDLLEVESGRRWLLDGLEDVRSLDIFQSE
jgi:hypothetical protein